MALHYLSWQEVFERMERASALANKPKIWGPPRGGAIVAGLIQAMGKGVAVMSPTEADLFVDDIYHSGTTQRRIEAVYGRKKWWFVIDKRRPEEQTLGWIVFPWEDPAEEAKDAETHEIIGRSDGSGKSLTVGVAGG
jgi:hypothetical protein